MVTVQVERVMMTGMECAGAGRSAASKRRPFRRVAALAVVLAGLALQAGPVRADENWDAAKSAFAACVALFPDVKAIHERLKADGWRYEGNESGLKIFSRNGYRAIAATQGSSQIATRCVVAASRLKPEPAIDHARVVAKELSAAKLIDLTARGVPVAWEGRLRGVKLRPGGVPQAEFGLMRGATLVLGEF